MNYISRFILICLVILLCGSSASALVIEDPFSYFNVYSLGDMGTANDYYSTDIYGTTGVAGNAYLNMAIGTRQINEYGLHTGGNAYFTAGSAHGKLDIGGNAEFRNFAVNVDVNAGGDVFLAQSTSGIGQVNAGGSVIKENPWSTIPTGSGVTYTPMIDFQTISQFFLDTSSTIGGMSSTGAIRTDANNSDVAYFDLNSGINVFELSVTDLYNTYSRVEIDGPSDAILYINAIDEIANLGWSLNWISDADYNSDVLPANVILNFPNATEITFGPSTSAYINILAPTADIIRDMGTTTGNLIAGNLYGNGQVNDGYFDYNTPSVPEPSTLLLMGSGAIGILGFRKKLRAS